MMEIDPKLHRDNCLYSKNLITCLAERAKMNCADWDGETVIFWGQLCMLFNVQQCSTINKESKSTYGVLKFFGFLEKFFFSCLGRLKRSLCQSIINTFEFFLQLELLVLVVGHVFFVRLEDFSLLGLIIFAEKVKAVIGNRWKCVFRLKIRKKNFSLFTYQLFDDIHMRVKHWRVNLFRFIEIRQQSADDGIFPLYRFITFFLYRLKVLVKLFAFYFSQYITPFTFNFSNIQASECVFFL